jgi:dihydropteroate synthase
MTTMPGFGAYDQDGYDDVVLEVEREWLARRDRAELEGLARDAIVFDPGLGFHKSSAQSWELLSATERFTRLGHKLCVGASRKSFLGSLDDSGPEDRLGGTIAACLFAAASGAQLLRVHDVAVVRQALLAQRRLERMTDAGDVPESRRRRPSNRVRHDA